ncbi:hypothetical protein LTR56_023900 [Elasticomyces elasticus]|nr:hypothetical protein LTR56_023900 [Elasticomyces elasticus]KAK3641731.1 hypothetical protein LTR22_016439 [Elasticomyces elasticus]KAK4917325.1 hypothetical protein LTR49_014809 [Elasticomyces elasticus]KAK5764858.1 hypothetical protein LTS12_004885 [Elasticomyces elasticus]
MVNASKRKSTQLGCMLLTYPPMRELLLYPHRGDEPHGALHVQNDAGLTMQDLADRFEAHEKECIACWKDAHWKTAASSNQKLWFIGGGMLVRRPKDGITGWEMLAMLRAAPRLRRIITAAEDQESD